MSIEVNPRKFHQGDVRTITLIMGESLAGWSASQFTFSLTRPDGGTVAMTSSRPVVDATTGQLSVKSVAGDFDENGTYLLQVATTTAPARSWPHVSLRVHGNTTPP